MKVDRSVPVEHSDKADYTVRERNSKKEYAKGIENSFDCDTFM